MKVFTTSPIKVDRTYVGSSASLTESPICYTCNQAKGKTKQRSEENSDSDGDSDENGAKLDPVMKECEPVKPIQRKPAADPFEFDSQVAYEDFEEAEHVGPNKTKLALSSATLMSSANSKSLVLLYGQGYPIYIHIM